MTQASARRKEKSMRKRPKFNARLTAPTPDDLAKIEQVTREWEQDRPISDTRVKCQTCHREERVNFGACLRSGWPKCCGATMSLLDRPSRATVDAAVASCVKVSQ